jgi:hypothetical protein
LTGILSGSGEEDSSQNAVVKMNSGHDYIYVKVVPKDGPIKAEVPLGRAAQVPLDFAAVWFSDVCSA